MSDTSAVFPYQWVEYRDPPKPRRLPPGLVRLAVLAAFVSTIPFRESITYGIDRLFYTPEELVEMQAVNALFTHIHIFRVACPDAGIDRQAWADYTAKEGWPLYPQGGAACVSPASFVDMSHVNNFQVACPTIAFSPADQQRWARVAALNDWTPYPQAGAACVDP